MRRNLASLMLAKKKKASRRVCATGSQVKPQGPHAQTHKATHTQPIENLT